MTAPPPPSARALFDGAPPRQVVVTLVKAHRTGGNSHWRSVVEGEGEIDTTTFGPSVLMADLTNPHDFAQHLDMLESTQGRPKG
jgi:hypothetical protein